MKKEAKEYYILSTGDRYPIDDLYGYPDTLIRSRVNISYKEGSGKVLNCSPAVVIDIGSCHGHGVKSIVEILNPELTLSTDRWHKFLKAQKEVFDRTFKEHSIRFITLKAPDIPLASNSVDTIFFIHVIEHIPMKDLIPLFEDFKRIIKPGGHIIISTPNAENLVAPNPQDEQVFDYKALDTFLGRFWPKREIFSLIPDKKAQRVHERKRFLATYLPITGKIRKKFPWRLWDAVVLDTGRKGLTPDNFYYSAGFDARAIDFLAICQNGQ